MQNCRCVNNHTTSFRSELNGSCDLMREAQKPTFPNSIQLLNCHSCCFERTIITQLRRWAWVQQWSKEVILQRISRISEKYSFTTILHFNFQTIIIEDKGVMWAARIFSNDVDEFQISITNYLYIDAMKAFPAKISLTFMRCFYRNLKTKEMCSVRGSNKSARS